MTGSLFATTAITTWLLSIESRFNFLHWLHLSETEATFMFMGAATGCKGLITWTQVLVN